MKAVFTTMDVHPRHRFEYWHDVACEKLIDHASIADCPQTFQAELRSGGLGEISLVSFATSPMTISHTKRQARQANPKEVFICHQLAGALTLKQDDRDTKLEPGHITLLDPCMPYSGKFSAGAEMLVLKTPRLLIESRVGPTRDMVCTPVGPAGGQTGILSAYLTALPSYVDTLELAGQEIVQNHVLDLLALSLLSATGRRRSRPSSARAILHLNIRAAIDGRLSDPTLKPAIVAAAAGISERYANTVLAQHGTSIMRLILARRLARCHNALKDPAQAHRTITEIAYGWGFSDMTHFGRAFRVAYGMLPSDFRKLSGTAR
ncbi:AraC-like ligand-binding domain-containing protein [Acidocella aminolytica]|nr:helix-turn-helix domain-containing protein [Acidocella aminolytica]SHF53060.1 AraC-type DNA-binding protein [Acidocella aminolytica 101 = DSM 11237]